MNYESGIVLQNHVKTSMAMQATTKLRRADDMTKYGGRGAPSLDSEGSLEKHSPRNQSLPGNRSMCSSDNDITLE